MTFAILRVVTTLVCLLISLFLVCPKRDHIASAGIGTGKHFIELQQLAGIRQKPYRELVPCALLAKSYKPIEHG